MEVAPSETGDVPSQGWRAAICCAGGIKSCEWGTGGEGGVHPEEKGAVKTVRTGHRQLFGGGKILEH